MEGEKAVAFWRQPRQSRRTMISLKCVEGIPGKTEMSFEPVSEANHIPGAISLATHPSTPPKSHQKAPAPYPEERYESSEASRNPSGILLPLFPCWRFPGSRCSIPDNCRIFRDIVVDGRNHLLIADGKKLVQEGAHLLQSQPS